MCTAFITCMQLVLAFTSGPSAFHDHDHDLSTCKKKPLDYEQLQNNTAASNNPSLCLVVQQTTRATKICQCH